jgi:hypothetical protein
LKKKNTPLQTILIDECQVEHAKPPIKEKDPIVGIAALKDVK